VITALATHGADHSLGDGVRLWRTHRRQDGA
jgi:hypothetical protein